MNPLHAFKRSIKSADWPCTTWLACIFFGMRYAKSHVKVESALRSALEQFSFGVNLIEGSAFSLNSLLALTIVGQVKKAGGRSAGRG